jgi:cation:H+ antiporter
MPLTVFLFVLGFIILVRGAGFLVDGSSSLARRLGISSLVIGLTIVAFGTSAPELFVNILSSIHGENAIGAGNILGANMTNILLVLGISVVIAPVVFSRGAVWKTIPIAFASMVLLAVLGNDLIGDHSGGILTRVDGLILLTFFSFFLFLVFRMKLHEEDGGGKTVLHSPFDSSVRILLGFMGLIIGGKWVVAGAIAFAQSLQVSEALIGLTIVSMGTTLPELATSITAVYKKHADIAVGTIIGSSIFNILFILGVSALIRPVQFSSALTSVVYMALGVTALLFVCMFVGKRNILKRWQGVTFIVLYILYIIYVIVRG